MKYDHVELIHSLTSHYVLVKNNNNNESLSYRKILLEHNLSFTLSFILSFSQQFVDFAFFFFN